jgi:hypothetical protein
MSTKTRPYCRAKACGSPLVEGQRYCEFHLERARDIAAKARVSMRKAQMEARGVTSPRGYGSPDGEHTC